MNNTDVLASAIASDAEVPLAESDRPKDGVVIPSAPAGDPCNKTMTYGGVMIESNLTIPLARVREWWIGPNDWNPVKSEADKT